MYNEFSTVNIQIDKDLSAKLSGYGCVGLLPETDLSDTSPVSGFKYKIYERNVDFYVSDKTFEFKFLDRQLL